MSEPESTRAPLSGFAKTVIAFLPAVLSIILVVNSSEYQFYGSISMLVLGAILAGVFVVKANSLIHPALKVLIFLATVAGYITLAFGGCLMAARMFS